MTNCAYWFFYEDKAIVNPVRFVMDFLQLWQENDGEPLKLYRGNQPVGVADESLVSPLLVSTEKDKTQKHKVLRLKSSLKKDQAVADFFFEHPDRKPLPTRPGQWKPPAASVSVNVLFRTPGSKQGYPFSGLFGLFSALISYNKVHNGCITLSSESEAELDYDVYRQITDASTKQNPVSYGPYLHWANFFTNAEFHAIRQKFQQENASFEAFCGRHALETVPFEQSGGTVLKMRDDVQDIAAYLRAKLSLNLDFHSVMNHPKSGTTCRP